MKVVLHPHASDRLRERGIVREEVMTTVLEGERVSAKYGRAGFRRNFNYGHPWRGKVYAIKQVEVFAVEESGHWLVLTAIARYF